MKYFLRINLTVWVLLAGWPTLAQRKGVVFRISRETLQDKIKGGWAGQTIGVTFGWPTEFVYQGTFIQDYQPIPWHADYVSEAMRTFPGLFDDIYMDLTFVEVIERLGIHAPADSFARAYAGAGYELWHANQAGRYNVLHGIPAARSGHWEHNPHADDIDFQIEADFAGLMSPGMPGAASALCDRAGHIMNYGDGWYGGVFVANMYAQAFRSNDVKAVVGRALRAIPAQSKFYQCIADVIRWHRRYPSDWKRTWFEIQRKWSSETGCPDGVFHPLNIDAKLNAAYVVLGLLYGNGDFTKTMEISTRAGQDSDCNPSTAGGVLGTMIGYSKIPAYWLDPLKKAERLPFSHTRLALQDVYELGVKHALQHVAGNGGRISGDIVEIPEEPVTPVRFEESFPGHFPTGKVQIGTTRSDSVSFRFDGKGFVLRGFVQKLSRNASDKPVRVALYVDDQFLEEFDLPLIAAHRRTELCWKYGLAPGAHRVTLKAVSPNPHYEIVAREAVVYQ